MIIRNGTIEAKMKTAGGINPATGFPAPNTGETWGAPVDCQWSAVTHDNTGRTVSGSFTLASYSVLIEQGPTTFNDGVVRLKDADGNVVSDVLSVISAEPLDAVGQVRILLE